MINYIKSQQLIEFKNLPFIKARFNPEKSKIPQKRHKMKDELFKSAQKKQFEFDASVASVFDDMINRSVPFYSENLSLCAKLTSKLAAPNASVCDLGCSTANLLILLFKLRPDLRLCGVDEAAAMLERAKNKAQAFGAKITLKQANLSTFKLTPSDIFIANYTLQFIRPPQRQSLVDGIFKALKKGGFLILSEKIALENAVLAKTMLEIYAEYKLAQGYSELEISSKREALENVLVPYTQKENLNMLANAGFKRIESFFKWANFESFIAFKD